MKRLCYTIRVPGRSLFDKSRLTKKRQNASDIALGDERNIAQFMAYLVCAKKGRNILRFGPKTLPPKKFDYHPVVAVSAEFLFNMQSILRASVDPERGDLTHESAPLIDIFDPKEIVEATIDVEVIGTILTVPTKWVRGEMGLPIVPFPRWWYGQKRSYLN